MLFRSGQRGFWERARSQQAVQSFVYFDSTTTDDGVYTVSTYSSPLTVDSTVSFSFALFTPVSPYLITTLTDPSGNNFPLTNLSYPGGLDHGTEWIPDIAYVIDTPIVGNWTVTLTVKSELLTKEVADALPVSLLGEDGEPDGLLILYNEDGVSLASQLSSYNLTVEIGRAHV